MPSDEKKIVDVLLDRALAHSRKGQIEQAAEVLRAGVRIFPDHASLWGLLGSMEYQLKAWQRSAKAYREAVRRSPESKLASLGLFHSLMHLGKQRSAIAELKRFQSVSHSDDYDAIARQMNIRVPAIAA
jgi:predicted Zn-dependent protease